MKKIIDEISAEEQKVIYECLLAAEDETIFPEWEFQTLFGIEKEEFTRIRKQWPNVSTNDPDVCAAIIGALNHLLGYPWDGKERWNKFVSVPPQSIQTLLEKLLSLGL